MIKKAFILAAGLGTRLGNLSKNKPKALVEAGGKAMLQIVIEKLKEAGIKEFVINIHHHGQQVIDFLDKNRNFNAHISISDEQSQLLDTGGAILKASKFFNHGETILVHNVDVLSMLNINELYDYHNQNNALATLCVRKRDSSRGLLFNNDMRLIGWENRVTNQYKWVHEPTVHYLQLAFSGIYMMNNELIDKLTFEGKFSIIDAWLKLARENTITGYLDRSEYWFDLGTDKKIKEAEKYLKMKSID